MIRDGMKVGERKVRNGTMALLFWPGGAAAAASAAAFFTGGGGSAGSGFAFHVGVGNTMAPSTPMMAAMNGTVLTRGKQS
jgi:hypothetical protein